MKVNCKTLSIKSTKHFGQLLLLETSDWNDLGQYIPDSSIDYDYFLLIRTKIEYNNDYKNGTLPEQAKLKSYIDYLNIQGEVTGSLSHLDFINQIIKYRYIIKQGQFLQGKIPMDAENYYVHAYDLDDPKTIIHPID